MTDLPEAPASITLSVVTPSGFPSLLTLREMTGTALLAKVVSLEKKITELGYKPQIKPVYGAKETKPIEYASYPCPTCGSKVTKGSTKDGKHFEVCETRKYNFQTKQTSGCAYIKWG